MSEVIRQFCRKGEVPRRVDLARAVMTGDVGDLGFIGALLMCVMVCRGGSTLLESIDKSRILQLEIEKMIHDNWDNFKRYEV